MLQQIFLSIVGFCSGIIIAGGVVGLLIGLSIVPRYAGITHTGKHILLYEDITLLGIVCGNLFFLYGWHIPGGTFALLLYGLFSGIFLGGWIMALAPHLFQKDQTDQWNPMGRDRGGLRKSFGIFVLFL